MSKLDRARNVDIMETLQQENTLGMVKSRQKKWKNRMQEKCMYRTTKTIERETKIEETDNYKSINQSINQSIKDACLQYWRSSLGLQIWMVSARTDVNNRHINHLELSIHLILGLPLNFLPSITPAYTLLVVPSLIMSSNLHFQFSCLLLNTSKMSSCLNSSFLTLSICSLPESFSAHSLVACTLPCCCFVKLHTSQPYHIVGTTVALTTFSFVLLLSHFHHRCSSYSLSIFFHCF